MNSHGKAAKCRYAFTLIELLVVVGIITVLAGMLLPVLYKGKERARSVACINNLKQISLALHSWALDNDERYPWNVATNSGGTKGVAKCWEQFGAISNHLTTPRILRCPSDDDRETAINFSGDEGGLQQLTNHAITYFLGIEASHKRPQMILSGDRASGEMGDCVIAGMGNITMLRTNASWDSNIHGKMGNAALEDGSVQHLTNQKFREQLEAVNETNFNNCAL